MTTTSLDAETDFGENIRGELQRRWTCEGLTDAAEVSNSINKLRKKIDFPLYDVKTLSKNSFHNMLRHAKAMDNLRGAVVDAIIVKSIHRLAGLTRKETRKKVDYIVDRHLKNLPMKWQNLRNGVPDILAQMRLVLKYRRRRLRYAVAVTPFNGPVDSGVVLVNLTVLCVERLKMLTIVPPVLSAISLTIPDAEMMNLGSGLVMDRFVVQLKPQYATLSGLELEKVVDDMLPGLSVTGTSADGSPQCNRLESVNNIGLMMRIELWDAALLVVLEHLLDIKSIDKDLSMLTSNMTRFESGTGIAAIALVPPSSPLSPPESTRDDSIVASDGPIKLSINDITVMRGVSVDHKTSYYEGILNSTGMPIFIKGTDSLLRVLLSAYHRQIYQGNPLAASGIGSEITTLLPPHPHLTPVVHDSITRRIEFDREINAMSRLGTHENVCRCVGFCQDDPRGVLLCYELVDGGNLTDLIKDTSKTYNIVSIALNIARGMAHLHQCGIVHRDLKSSNIVISSKLGEDVDIPNSPTRPSDLWNGVAKVCDFGLSCVIDGRRDMTAETGTYRWMAPEIIRHEEYSFPADVYSFAIVLWELAAREHPYAGLTPIQAAFSVAKHDLRPNIPDGIHPRLKAIMTRCWHPAPLARPSFSDIVDLLVHI